MHKLLSNKSRKAKVHKGITFQVDENSYQHILQFSNKFCQILLEYTASISCDENILVLIDIYQMIEKKPFKKYTGEMIYCDNNDPSTFMLECATYLYNRYIGDEAKKQLNISHNLNQQIQETVHKIIQINETKDNYEDDKYTLCQTISRQIADLETEIETFVNGSIMVGFNKWIKEPEQNDLLEELRHSPFSPRTDSNPVIPTMQKEIQLWQTYRCRLLLDLLILLGDLGAGVCLGAGITMLSLDSSPKTGLIFTIGGGAIFLLLVLLTYYRYRKLQTQTTEQKLAFNEHPTYFNSSPLHPL